MLTAKSAVSPQKLFSVKPTSFHLSNRSLSALTVLCLSASRRRETVRRSSSVFVMSSSAQRKRGSTGRSLVSRTGTKTSRAANGRTVASRVASAEGEPAPLAETIDVPDNSEDDHQNFSCFVCNVAIFWRQETSDQKVDGRTNILLVVQHLYCLLDAVVEEVVDLTCEASEAAVVDLTSNDSVLLVDEGPLNRRVPAGESYVLSSDEDDDTPPILNAATMSSAHASRSTPGLISCPVCLDLYSEIVESGRLVVSTKCGHVFCSQCLRDALTSSHTCPTCRKRLTSRQYHPLYI